MTRIVQFAIATHARRQSSNTAIASFARAAEPGTGHQPQDGGEVAQARDGRGYEDRADGTALDGFGCALTEQPIQATGMPGLAVLQDKCRAPVMAEMAICAGMSPYGGTMLEGVIGTAASLHLFCALERMPLGCALFGSDLATDRITTTALTIQDGVLLLNAGPGLGVEIDKAKLARYRRPEAPARSVA